MTHSLQPNLARKRLNADDIRRLFQSGTDLLKSNVDLVDRLNVFPVPDGDTGTNMYLTVRETIEKPDWQSISSASEAAEAMSHAAMMASRGNSGLILSQLFRGLAEAFQNSEDVGVPELVKAFELGRRHAYSVLSNPVEGTILTVFTAADDAASEYEKSGDDLIELFEAVCRSARAAVVRTPDLLPRLKEAGVVDAGGLGLYIILEGARSSLSSDGGATSEVDLPVTEEMVAYTGQVSPHFLDLVHEDSYGYCTQFVVSGSEIDRGNVQSAMDLIGRSTVVVGGGAAVKVHVHIEEPDAAVESARAFGEVSDLQIQDMDEQHRQFDDARRRDAASAPSDAPHQDIAVVAVAWGDGLEEIFREQGAQVLVAGDTMNPSVRQIVDAVESAPSENVIFLPNNPNIVPAARQAAEISDKNMLVVPSTSIPQGIASVLELNPTADALENASRMEERLSSVQTAEVTQAVRSVSLNGIDAAEGQIIGLLERDLVAAGEDAVSVLLEVLEVADKSEVELVTLYSGAPIGRQEAEEGLSRAEAAYPYIEFELVRGGQPHYHFIVSLE